MLDEMIDSNASKNFHTFGKMKQPNYEKEFGVIH